MHSSGCRVGSMLSSKLTLLVSGKTGLEDGCLWLQWKVLCVLEGPIGHLTSSSFHAGPGLQGCQRHNDCLQHHQQHGWVLPARQGRQVLSVDNSTEMCSLISSPGNSIDIYTVQLRLSPKDKQRKGNSPSIAVL